MANMMDSLIDMALNQLTQGRTLTPIEQSYVDVIRNRDSEKGQQIAMNLCQSNNCNKDQALNMAGQFFRQQFHM